MNINNNIDYIPYPVSLQTVDMFVWDHANSTVYLGRKKERNKFQLFGGFVDPKDQTLEMAAERELIEEFPAIRNVSYATPVYIGSFRINDERYVDSSHKIMTALFFISVRENILNLKAGDDIEEIKAFNLKDWESFKDKNIIMSNHQILFEAGLKWAMGIA